MDDDFAARIGGALMGANILNAHVRRAAVRALVPEVQNILSEYAHELAEKQRVCAALMLNQDLADGVRQGADLIDPEKESDG